MTEQVKLGKPKYEQGTKNYFTFKKDQNTFILRVLPPMGNLADAGKWSVYHRVEFGHVGTDTKMKPFLSPRKVNYDGMVEVESISHTRREGIKAQLEQAKLAGNAQLQEQCNLMLRKYNQDAKHYMNVLDLQGNVGLFKIGHRGYQSLKAEIERLRSEGVDPIGVADARFFVFARSGKGRDTIYTVTEYKQKRNMDDGQGGQIQVEAPFPHSINDAIMGKLATDAFELDKVYPSVTAEEETRIVNEGAVAVDAILGKKKKQEATANPASSAPAQEAAPAEQAPAQEAVGGNLQQPTAEVAGETVNTATGEILEKAPAQEAVATTTVETPVETAPVTNPAAGVADMSEEEFFKKVQSGNF